MENVAAVNGGLSTPQIVGAIIAYVLVVIAYWKIFTKAGEEGWKAIIPVYNMYIICKIACNKGWMFILYLIPIVGFFVNVYMDWKLLKAFGYGMGMFILSIFLPNIVWLIVGFSSAEYLGPQ